MRDALVRIGRIRRTAARADRPRRRPVYGYRNKLEYSFSAGEDGRRARVPSRRALGRGRRHRGVPPDDRPRQRDPARRARAGRGRSSLEPYDQATGTGYLRHLVVREGRNTGQALVRARDRARRAVRDGLPRRRPPARSRRCARSTGRSTTRRPSGRTSRRSSSGARTRSRRRSSASASGPPGRVPADEHRDGGAALRARPRVRGAHGDGERASTSTAAPARSARARPRAPPRCGGSRSPRSRSPARSRTPS